MTTWGVVSTIKAPAQDILRFAAWHLEAGAQRIYIYLDAPNPAAAGALKTHPKCRVVLCDDDYWRKRRPRPAPHQSRQTYNANRAYRRADVDWLAHFDVDEFLISPQPLTDVLGNLPPDQRTARIRPMELLADGDGTAFKDFIQPPNRDQLTNEIYPTYGEYLAGGFLSHLAGKIVVRTGLEDIRLRIHNSFADKEQITDCAELTDLRLAHLHAKDWESWYAHFRYRLENGSYRASLGPTRRRSQGGMTMHQLFSMIEADNSEQGLRDFFQEVVADTPKLRDRLEARNLLRIVQLDTDALVTRHFPFFTTV